VVVGVWGVWGFLGFFGAFDATATGLEDGGIAVPNPVNKISRYKVFYLYSRSQIRSKLMRGYCIVFRFCTHLSVVISVVSTVCTVLE
jgi:hypothetical protein